MLFATQFAPGILAPDNIFNAVGDLWINVMGTKLFVIMVNESIHHVRKGR